MGLYNRIDELRKLRCDVFLLTKGPPIGSSGGAYIKLIGVPFRKLYDMNEAEEQLKMNRKSALEYNGWRTLCKVRVMTYFHYLHKRGQKVFYLTSFLNKKYE